MAFSARSLMDEYYPSWSWTLFPSSIVLDSYFSCGTSPCSASTTSTSTASTNNSRHLFEDGTKGSTTSVLLASTFDLAWFLVRILQTFLLLVTGVRSLFLLARIGRHLWIERKNRRSLAAISIPSALDRSHDPCDSTGSRKSSLALVQYNHTPSLATLPDELVMEVLK